jgi:hypothetical protein
MVEEIDIHNSKKRYTDFVQRINNLSESEGKQGYCRVVP